MGSVRILPLLIIIIILAFSLRLSEVITGVSSLSDKAYAEEKARDDEYEDDKESKKPSKVEDASDTNAPKWRDASDSDFDISDVKMEMFEDLRARRQQLDDMESEYHMRDALLSAAEKELDRKYQELLNLKSEIEGLLKLQEKEEQERIGSLVKIYEGMKPKDAARIFDTLDIDVLVSVLTKMSERKISPILAAMNAERARTVTIMMAEEKTLPDL